MTKVAAGKSSGGHCLASCSRDRTVPLWQIGSGECQVRGHTDEVFAVAFHPDGTRLATAGRDGAVWLWDPARRQAVARLPGHKSYVWSLAFSPDVAGLPADNADEFPELPALASAPNGRAEALVPVAEWKRAFKAVPGARACRGKPILANVAAVFGEGVTTLATTDLDTQTVLQPRNVEGRFPDIKTAAMPKGAPVAKVKMNADLLARLLKVAAEFTEDDGGAVTVELRQPTSPVVVRARHGGQEFTGLIMPLS